MCAHDEAIFRPRPADIWCARVKVEYCDTVTVYKNARPVRGWVQCFVFSNIYAESILSPWLRTGLYFVHPPPPSSPPPPPPSPPSARNYSQRTLRLDGRKCVGIQDAVNDTRIVGIVNASGNSTRQCSESIPAAAKGLRMP